MVGGLVGGWRGTLEPTFKFLDAGIGFVRREPVGVWFASLLLKPCTQRGIALVTDVSSLIQVAPRHYQLATGWLFVLTGNALWFPA